MTAAPLAFRPRHASRLLGAAPSELTFRVVGGEHAGRELAVRSLKCTIGSALGCTIRLAARGVRPLHCWILRGPGGTVVRSLNPHTRHNGRPFSDAPLAPGDRLRIGSVELEVVGCPVAPNSSWTVHSPELPELPPAVDLELQAAEEARRQAEEAQRQSEQTATQLRDELHGLERRAAEQLGESNAVVGRITAERDEISARLGRLETETAAERSELAQRLQSVENASSGDRAQLASRIQAIESEAASERDALRQEKERLELSLSTTEQTLAELRSHLGSREAEIESLLHIESRRVAEIQTRLEQVVRERAELQTRLNQERATLQADVQTHQAAVDRVQSECARLEAELAKLRENVGYTSAERDNLTVRLNQVSQEQGDQHQQLAVERTELQRKLDAALAQLADAERRLAALQAEGAGHAQTEIAQDSALQQKIEQVESEKGELAHRLAEQTTAWHNERESLRQQTQRVTEHCQQVEGQLVHVRELVENMASDRDSLCQQLEAAGMRLEAEKQAWQEQKQGLEQQLQGRAANNGELDRKLAETNAQLEGETARANQWAERKKEAETRLAAAHQQLAEAAERFAALKCESEGRLHNESSRAAQLTQEAEQGRARLSVTQVALADAETRMAALQSKVEHQLSFERGRIEAAEQRGAELSLELAASDLRLAEAERRLSAFRIEGETRLLAESQKNVERERQVREAAELCESLRKQLEESQTRGAAMGAELGASDAAQQHTRSAAADRWQQLQAQLAGHESQLSALTADFEARLDVQADRAEAAQRRMSEQQTAALAQVAHWERRLAEADANKAQLESRLAEQIELLKSERESWQIDRQQQAEVCESLRRQAAENERKLAEMTQQDRAGSEPTQHSQMTVTMAELNQAQKQEVSPDGAIPSVDERVSWDAERKQLEECIAGLQQKLADPTNVSQTMTMGSDALGELQSQMAGEPTNDQITELQARLNALQCDLAEAAPWQDRCREALASADEARARAEGLATQVTELEARLEAQASAPPPESLSMTIAAESVAGQSSDSPALDDEQQRALKEERRSLTEEREFLEAARNELANERDAFQQSQNEFEATWRRWEGDLRAKEQLLQSQAAELTDRLDGAIQRAAELDQQRTQLSEQQAAFEVRLAQSGANATPVEAIQPPPASAVHGNNDRNEDWTAPADSQSKVAEKPVSAEGVPGPAAQADEMQEIPVEKTRVSEVAVRRSTSITSNRPKPVWTQPDQPAPRADDDSIEAYMARLLKRVRGDSPPAEAKWTPPTPSESTLPSAESGTLTAPGVSSRVAESDETSDSEPAEKVEEMVPRNRPPELSMSLVAMRQVANTVARTAIVKHQRKNGSDLAVAQMVGAGLTFGCTIIAAFFAYCMESLLVGVAAAVGAMATCYWGGRSLGHALRAMLLRMPTGETLVLPLKTSAQDADGIDERSPDSPRRSLLDSLPSAGSEAGEIAGQTQVKGATQGPYEPDATPEQTAMAAEPERAD